MKEIINGTHTIISNKTPSINNKRLEISKPNPGMDRAGPGRAGLCLEAPCLDLSQSSTVAVRAHERDSAGQL